MQRAVELKDGGEVDIREVDGEEVWIVPVGRGRRAVDTGVQIGVEFEWSVKLTILRVRPTEGQTWDKFSGADREVAGVLLITT